jgi:hypothetical protein
MNDGRLINYFVNCVKVIFDCVSLALLAHSYLKSTYLWLSTYSRSLVDVGDILLKPCSRAVERRPLSKTVSFKKMKTCMLLLY